MSYPAVTNPDEPVTLTRQQLANLYADTLTTGYALALVNTGLEPEAVAWVAGERLLPLITAKLEGGLEFAVERHTGGDDA